MIEIVKDTSEQMERLKVILDSYKFMYERDFSFRETSLRVEDLLATEPYLEAEKLAVVYKKMVQENYDVPIITVRKDSKSYVIDGHHRCFSKWLLNQGYILSYEIQNELFKPPWWSKSVLDIPMIKTGEDIEEVRDWATCIGTLEYLRRIHGINFKLIPMKLEVENLIPTQYPQRMIGSRTPSKAPILVLKYKDSFYIVDGHTRTYYALKKRERYIDALVLVPAKEVIPGIVLYSKRLGINSIKEFAKMLEMG
ncbi:MAG: hypothetical protein ACP5LN_05695 [Thermoproteota archaeon]|jgi:hypothetical protein